MAATDTIKIECPSGMNQKGVLQTTSLDVDLDQFLQVVVDYEDFIPDKPTFIYLISAAYPFSDDVRREICPIGLVDESHKEIIEMEAFCSEYKCLPYSGAMDEQPQKLIDAFNVIRGTKNEYQARKIMKASEK